MSSISGTGSFANLRELLGCDIEDSDMPALEENVSEIPDSDECSSSQPSSSLLDILIKAEQGLKHGEETNDPLEGIGDIGDAVISQLAGETIRDTFGETSIGDDDLTVSHNALKLFDEAMSYTKPAIPPKRKYTRWKSLTNAPDAMPSTMIQIDPMKNLTKAEVRTSYPRANFNISCAEMFQNNRKPDEIFQILHDKLEEERNHLIENQVAKDVDRLLGAATKVYGPRAWTSEERKEFGNYCKNLRSNRGLTIEDRLGIKNFYAKAYKLDDKTAARSSFLFCEEFIRANAMPPRVMPPSQPPTPIKRKTNHKAEESALYSKPEKRKAKEGEDAGSGEEQTLGLVSPPSSLELPFAPFHPGMKYEKEKVFRSKIISMFLELFLNHPKKRGRPKMTTRLAVPVEPEGVVEEPGPPIRKKDEDVEFLINRLNEVMKEKNKIWSQEDVDGLGRYYEIFKDKMSFTIIQTKELGTYLRKVYGRLEKYELERENDTALQEKRKYWQEYKRSHEPIKKERKTTIPKRETPVRPYIRTGIDTTGESEAQKRARKAAYLREWRLRRAEKQNVELCSRLITTLENPPTEETETV